MERFLTNDRLISYHRNRLDVKEFPKDKLNMAYLDTKFEQFLNHLNQIEDIEMIKKVLKEIFNQLQSGDEVYKYSVKYPQLLKRVFHIMQNFRLENVNQEECVNIRTRASLCFRQFCLILKTKELLDKECYIKNVHKCFKDYEANSVRENVYQGLVYFTQSRWGVDVLLKNGVLAKAISQIAEEKEQKVLELILVLTNEILDVEDAPQNALENNMVKLLKSHLDQPLLKRLVLINYGSLSLCEAGKKACVSEGTLVKTVVGVLNEEKNKVEILVPATRFLMSVTILKQGKVEVYENGAIEQLINFLEEYDDEQLLLNILQTLANVAEEPRARKLLLGSYLDNVQRFFKHEDDLIHQQAKITSDIITWKP